MTYIDWHLGIRKAYPDASLIITGENLEDLVVIDQETGLPFEFDSEIAKVKSAEAILESQYAYLRRKRNQLLAETDYLALADVTLTDEMRAYRQALRDLPANTPDPANPVWPTKPEQGFDSTSRP